MKKLLIAPILFASTAGCLTAASLTWNGNGADTNLTTVANWVGSPTPANGDDLTFSTSPITNTTMNMDTAFTAKSVIFNGFNLFTSINGSNGLTIDTNSASAANGILVNASNTPTINAPLVINNTLAGSTTIAANNSLTLGGSLTTNTTTRLQQGAGATLTVNGVLGGAGTITTAGGTAILGGSASNTHSDVIRVVGGNTLALAKTGGAEAFTGSRIDVDGSTSTLRLDGSDQLNTNLRFQNGGVFNLNGFSESVGGLTMASGGSILFGAGAEDLSFVNSSGLGWSGTLNIVGFNASEDTLRFGSDAGGLTTIQLSQISFDGFGAAIDSSGYLTAVPEPSASALIFGGMSLLFLLRRRTR